jgi:hypothetical protein
VSVLLAPARQLWQGCRDFLWGLFVFDLYRNTLVERHKYQDAMNLIILGEMIGIPLMNSVVTLRLLPYVLGDLADWKKRQLIEYEVLERAPEWH